MLLVPPHCVQVAAHKDLVVRLTMNGKRVGEDRESILRRLRSTTHNDAWIGASLLGDQTGFDQRLNALVE